MESKDFFQTKDYRRILLNEFETRASGQPMSMRTFAALIGLSPPRLCQVIQGKDGLSRKSARRISERLGFSQIESKYFCDLVDAEHARSRALRQEALRRLEQSRMTDPFDGQRVKASQIIGNWHHFAILELLSLTGAKSDASWVARSLGISILEAELAIERLVKHGLLLRKAGRLRPSTGESSTITDVPSEALREHHSRILQRADSALKKQAVTDRDFSSMIMAVAADDIEFVKSELRKFRRQLARTLEKRGSKDKVYVLSMQYFNLSEGL